MKTRAGIWQRGVYFIEPSRAFATIAYGLLAVAAVGSILLYRSGFWPPTWPALPFQAPRWALLVGVAFAGLLILAAIVNGRRWRTARAIMRLSKEVGAELPPGQVQPAGPYAWPRPELRVPVVRPPRFRQRPKGLRRITATQNVLGRLPLHIVYLRVFENQPRARTFVRGAWREFGYVYLLRSAAAVSPAQFRRAKKTGQLRALFVNSESKLRAKLDRAPTEPYGPGLRAHGTIAGSSVLVFDRYGAYPVCAVTCAAAFWQQALDELLRRADLVVLDLSGYRTKNAGTQYELQRIVDTFPVSRVILLADPWSNKRYLQDQVQDAWQHMAAGSPNARSGPQVVPLAITDYYVQIEMQSATSSAPAQTRTELRASRAQTRWLLERAPQCVHEGRPGPTDTPPWPVPPRNVAPPPPRWPYVVAALVAVTTAAALVWTAVGGRLPGINTGGVDASVVSDHNIRAGPSTDFPIVGIVRAGDDVVVDCLDQGWARLDAPSSGGYVSMEGLRFAETPPPC
jgi:hypothetical protein